MRWYTNNTIMIWYREIHEKGSGDFVLCRGIDSVYSVQTAETTSPLFVNSSAGQWDDTQSHRLILLWYSNQYYISYTFKLQSNLPKQYKISIHSLKCTIHLFFSFHWKHFKSWNLKKKLILQTKKYFVFVVPT